MAHLGVPGQQQLPDAALRLLCQQRPAQRRPGQQLCLGATASNKPYSAERSTPVWLTIWRTWAGFANSQLWRATIRCTY